MRYYPHKSSLLAHWSRRLAVFGAAVAIVGVLLARYGIFPPLQSLAVFGAGLILSSIAMVLAVTAFVDIWRTGSTGLPKANAGLLLALVTLAVPAYEVVRGLRLPAINDISTDLKDPPAFSRSRSAQEARGGVVPTESSPETREEQRKAYREVAPVVLELSPEEAYQLVLEAAAAMKWQIVDRAPPSVRVGAGRVDAVDRTSIMRFPDDITIRIRPLPNETRIDIRSVSRIGRHDLGANAERIRRFSDALIRLNKG